MPQFRDHPLAKEFGITWRSSPWPVIIIILLVGGLTIFVGLIYEQRGIASYVVHAGLVLLLIGGIGALLETEQFRSYFETRFSEIFTSDKMLLYYNRQRLLTLRSELTKKLSNNWGPHCKEIFALIEEQLFPKLDEFFHDELIVDLKQRLIEVNSQKLLRCEDVRTIGYNATSIPQDRGCLKAPWTVVVRKIEGLDQEAVFGANFKAPDDCNVTLVKKEDLGHSVKYAYEITIPSGKLSKVERTVTVILPSDDPLYIVGVSKFTRGFQLIYNFPKELSPRLETFGIHGSLIDVQTPTSCTWWKSYPSWIFPGQGLAIFWSFPKS